MNSCVAGTNCPNVKVSYYRAVLGRVFTVLLNIIERNLKMYASFFICIAKLCKELLF